MDEQNQAMDDPNDIAEAFQLLKRQEQGIPDPAGEGAGSDEGEGTAADGGGIAVVPSGDEAGVQSPEGDEGESIEYVPEGADDAGDGGPSASESENDYSAGKEQLIRNIQQQALREVTKEFNDNGVKMKWGMEDLYRRDEDGTVHFDNPDKPGDEFTSRSEANAWLMSMNSSINEAFKDRVAQKQRELYKQAAPSIMLLEFGPTYDMMDAQTKDVFNDLVEPYSVFNQAGELIGFNCNLNKMAAQAQKITSRFAGKPQEKQAQQQQAKPAKKGSGNLPDMDAKTSAGDGGQQMYDPKNIEEAMALSAKLRKEKANG